MSLSIPTAIAVPMQLSFSKILTSQNPFLLCLQPPKPISIPRKTTVIRMGGGPRTYPGGVSKWQWKRMQAKKAKQLLKARLCRERQIYEMRKRAELKAAVSELERPWEVVERAPNLFSVKADEQVKVLADRFQKPGGFDLWSENDGPQLFHSPDGLPTARFFPKGVVHSVRPYGLIHGEGGGVGVGFDELESDSEDMGDFDGEMRENWGGVFRSLDRKKEENGDRYTRRSESGTEFNKSRDAGWSNRSSGLRDSRYNEMRDESLMLSSESRTNRSGNDGRIGSFRGDGETRTSRNRNDDRVSRIGGSSSSRDRALRQHGEARTKGRNDDRISRSGGLRNSRSNGDGSLMRTSETRTNRSGNDSRNNRVGSLRSSRYSSDSGDGETRTSRSRSDDGVSRAGGSSSFRYFESRDRPLRQHGEARTKGKNDGRRISKSGGLRNSRYSSESEAYDMSLQQDGSYGLRERDRSYGPTSGADI